MSWAEKGREEGATTSITMAFSQTRGTRDFRLRKIPTPIKIKLALPPHPSKRPNPPPPKTRILWAWGFSSRKNQKMPGAHKIGAAISGPRIAGRKITGASAV